MLLNIYKGYQSEKKICGTKFNPIFKSGDHLGPDFMRGLAEAIFETTAKIEDDYLFCLQTL